MRRNEEQDEESTKLLLAWEMNCWEMNWWWYPISSTVRQSAKGLALCNFSTL